MALDWEDLTGGPHPLDPGMVKASKDDLKKIVDWMKLLPDRAAMGAMMLPEGGYGDWQGKVEEGTGLAEALTGKALDRPPDWQQVLGTVAPGYGKYIKPMADQARREQPTLAMGENAMDAARLASMVLLLPNLAKFKRGLASSDWVKDVVPETVNLDEIATQARGFAPGLFHATRERVLSGEIPRERGLDPRLTKFLDSVNPSEVRKTEAATQEIAPWVTGTREGPDEVFPSEFTFPATRELIAGFADQRLRGNPQGIGESYIDTLNRLRTGDVPRFEGAPVGLGKVGDDPDKMGRVLANLVHRLHINNDLLFSSTPSSIGLRALLHPSNTGVTKINPWSANEGLRVFSPQDTMSIGLNNLQLTSPEKLARTSLHEGGHAINQMAFVDDPNAVSQAMDPGDLATMYESLWGHSLSTRRQGFENASKMLRSPDEAVRAEGQRKLNYFNSLSELMAEATPPVIRDFNKARRDMPLWSQFFRDEVTQAPEVRDRFKWMVGLLAPYIASQEAMNPANQEQPAP